MNSRNIAKNETVKRKYYFYDSKQYDLRFSHSGIIESHSEKLLGT